MSFFQEALGSSFSPDTETLIGGTVIIALHTLERYYCGRRKTWTILTVFRRRTFLNSLKLPYMVT